MPTVLVTGANRGLGLELARQYAADGWTVHACARDPEDASELQALAEGSGGAIRLHRLDLADLARTDALAKELAGETLDLLLSNAGAYGREAWSLGALDYDVWQRTLLVNAVAPVRLVEAFLPQLERAKQPKVVAVTSKMGSLDDNTSGAAYAYRSSKAALNAAMKSLSIDTKPRGLAVCVIHPGWVRTRMGGASAPLEPAESVAGMRRVIAGLGAAQSGRFWNWDGAEIAW